MGVIRALKAFLVCCKNDIATLVKYYVMVRLHKSYKGFNNNRDEFTEKLWVINSFYSSFSALPFIASSYYSIIFLVNFVPTNRKNIKNKWWGRKSFRLRNSIFVVSFIFAIAINEDLLIFGANYSENNLTLSQCANEWYTHLLSLSLYGACEYWQAIAIADKCLLLNYTILACPLSLMHCFKSSWHPHWRVWK